MDDDLVIRPKHDLRMPSERALVIGIIAVIFVILVVMVAVTW